MGLTVFFLSRNSNFFFFFFFHFTFYHYHESFETTASERFPFFAPGDEVNWKKFVIVNFFLTGRLFVELAVRI